MIGPVAPLLKSSCQLGKENGEVGILGLEMRVVRFGLDQFTNKGGLGIVVVRDFQIRENRVSSFLRLGLRVRGSNPVGSPFFIYFVRFYRKGTWAGFNVD